MINKTNCIDEPFLLVYDSRSGSTFLANLLVKYLGAAIPPETNFVTRVLYQYDSDISNETQLQEILDLVYADSKFNDWQIQREELNQYLERNFPISLKDFILQVCSLYRNKYYPDSRIFGLKKGGYLLKYQRMKEVFPQAKFIEIIRDGRAVFHSKKHSIYSVTGKPFETNPCRAAAEWGKMCELFREASKKFPKETISIKYEQMITDPDKTIKKLGQFLKVDCVNKDDSKSYIIPERYGKLHQNINKKPLQERIDAWQQSLTLQEIYDFEAIAYQNLLLSGYKVANLKNIIANLVIKKAKHILNSLVGSASD